MRQDYPLKQRLLTQAARTKSPITATFELTPRCNLRCRMCYIRMTPAEMAARGREHTADEWLRLGKEAADAGTLFLLLTGGEPLLRPDFGAIYRGLSGLGFSLSINTNGTLLDDAVLGLLSDLPPAAVNVTLYGAGRASYERLCGDASAYDRAVRAIDRLVEAGVPTVLNTTLTRCNADDLEAIAAFANARGLELRPVTYLFPPVRRDGEGPERFSPEQAGVLSARARICTEPPEQIQTRAAAIRANLPDPTPPDECLTGGLPGLRCTAGNCQYWVAWNGEMYPCGMLPTPVVHPFETGLLPAWRELTSACADLRAAAQCAVCKLRPYCPACAAAAMAETGRTDGVPDYICRLTAAYCKFLVNNPPGTEEEDAI